MADSWPRDPRLDPFRDAVWELSRRGKVEAYLTCRVIPTRPRSNPWARTELLWYRVNWLTGRRDRPREDYGPGWVVVAGLEKGSFEYDDIATLTFEAQPAQPGDRDSLWKQYGPPA